MVSFWPRDRRTLNTLILIGRGNESDQAGSSTRRLLARGHRHRNLTFVIEGVEHADQAIEGEPAIVSIAYPREIRGGEASQCMCLSRREFALIENADDLGRENVLGLADIGVGIVEIRPDIAAAPDDLQLSPPPPSSSQHLLQLS